MKGCTAIMFHVTAPYLSIKKGSIVHVEGEKFEIKRLVEIILLEKAVVKIPTIRVTAWAIKQSESKEE